MNIVFLTVEERLYLPAFFMGVLDSRADDTVAIFKCPMKHGKQSTLDMVKKYWKTFGTANLVRLGARELSARLTGKLPGSDTPCSITAVAKKCRIPADTVRDVNAPAFHKRLRELRTDLIVSISCPQIFGQELIDLPSKGCLNMHGALLPKYRGIAPSFWMMRHGEKTAGVTVFRVTDTNIDLGEIVEVDEFPIEEDETLEQFIIRSKAISVGTVLRAIDRVESGPRDFEQLEADAGSYFGFPKREDYLAFVKNGNRLW